MLSTFIHALFCCDVNLFGLCCFLFFHCAQRHAVSSPAVTAPLSDRSLRHPLVCRSSCAWRLFSSSLHARVLWQRQVHHRCSTKVATHSDHSDHGELESQSGAAAASVCPSPSRVDCSPRRTALQQWRRGEDERGANARTASTQGGTHNLPDDSMRVRAWLWLLHCRRRQRSDGSAGVRQPARCALQVDVHAGEQSRRRWVHGIHGEKAATDGTAARAACAPPRRPARLAAGRAGDSTPCPQLCPLLCDDVLCYVVALFRSTSPRRSGWMKPWSTCPSGEMTVVCSGGVAANEWLCWRQGGRPRRR